MVDVISCAVVALNSAGSTWPHVQGYINTLFDKPRPASLNLIITLISPRISWRGRDEDAVIRWAGVASAVQHTEEVGQSMVDALLQIASVDSLRPHVPIGLWARMKGQLSLPPYCLGRNRGTTREVVRLVRGLGDVEILKSYFLLVWSEWDYPGAFIEMSESIREYLGGIRMQNHRKDLIERLDHVLRQLDRGLVNSRQHNSRIGGGDIGQAKYRYEWLKWVLLTEEGEVVDGTHCTPPDFTDSNKILITDSNGVRRMPPDSWLCSAPRPNLEAFRAVGSISSTSVLSSTPRIFYSPLLSGCTLSGFSRWGMVARSPLWPDLYSYPSLSFVIWVADTLTHGWMIGHGVL